MSIERDDYTPCRVTADLHDYELRQSIAEQNWERQTSIFKAAPVDYLYDNLNRIDPNFLLEWCRTSPDFCSLMQIEVIKIDMDEEAYREADEWRNDTIAGIEI